MPISTEAAAVAIRQKDRANRIKYTTWGIILCSLVLICYVYLDQTQVIDVVDVKPYLNKSYSRQSTIAIVQEKVEHDEAVKVLSDAVEVQLLDEAVEIPTIAPGNRRCRTDIYDEDFCEINNYLYDFCTEYTNFNLSINGKEVPVDGLLYMATCNAESSGWTCDTSVTASGAFPSALIPITTDESDPLYYYKNIINRANILTAFSCAVNKGWYNIPASDFLKSRKPWIADLTTQGPSTQAFTTECTLDLGANEKSILTADSDAYNALVRSYGEEYMNKVLGTCTGSDYYEKFRGTLMDSGDRWELKDELEVYSWSVHYWANGLSKQYCYGDMPNDYETILMVRSLHWIPGIIAGGAGGYQEFGFRDKQQWFAYFRCLSQKPVIDYVRSKVKERFVSGKPTDLVAPSLNNSYYNEVFDIVLNLPESTRTWIDTDNNQHVLERDDFSRDKYGIESAKCYGPNWLFNYMMMCEIFSEEAVASE